MRNNYLVLCGANNQNDTSPPSITSQLESFETEISFFVAHQNQFLQLLV